MSLSAHYNHRTAVMPFQKLVLATAALALFVASKANAADAQMEYRVLATSRTSTMEKELNNAALSGYRFSKVMGGKTANGGQEVAIAMLKRPLSPGQAIPHYKLLATTRTSTMQRELQQWADAGYEYLGQTVFETAFGGKEVVVIMEQDSEHKTSTPLYRLLATSKTSTMERELNDAGNDGFLLVGFTVGKTEIGGEEIVAILRKD
jgi:opacity protein-like surface antigen